MGRTRNKNRLFLAVAAALLLALILSSSYFCPLYRFWGIPCPGCGLTRAFFSLCKGDFAASFAYHPLLIPVAGYLCVAAVFLLCGRRDLLRSKGFVYSFLALMLTFWAVRLILVALGRSSVPFNEQAVLIRIISRLTGG